MSKIIVFIIQMIKMAGEDDIFSIAGDLTYKLLLSLFPFIIFLITILGYLNFEIDPLSQQLDKILTYDVLELIRGVLEDTISTKNPSLLSLSLAFTLFSASSGFRSVMKGINKAYGIKDERNFIVKNIVSVLLVLLFVIMVVLVLIMLIFNNSIYQFISDYLPDYMDPKDIFNYSGYFLTIGALFLGVLMINGLSLGKRIPIKKMVPGGLFTVIIWVIASKGFNIYVINFSIYSAIYGSLTGMIVFLVWLNIICSVLLLGSEFNVLYEKIKLTRGEKSVFKKTV